MIALVVFTTQQVYQTHKRKNLQNKTLCRFAASFWNWKACLLPISLFFFYIYNKHENRDIELHLKNSVQVYFIDDKSDQIKKKSGDMHYKQLSKDVITINQEVRPLADLFYNDFNSAASTTDVKLIF